MEFTWPKPYNLASPILLAWALLSFSCTQPHPADELVNRGRVRPIDMVNTTYCSAIDLEAFLFENEPNLLRLCEPKIFSNGTLVKFIVPMKTKMRVIEIKKVQTRGNSVSVIPIVEFQVEGNRYRAGIDWLCDRYWGIDYLRPNSNWIVRCD